MLKFRDMFVMLAKQSVSPHASIAGGLGAKRISLSVVPLSWMFEDWLVTDGVAPQIWPRWEVRQVGGSVNWQLVEGHDVS